MVAGLDGPALGRLSAVLALVAIAGCGGTPPGTPTSTETGPASPGMGGSPTVTVTDTPTPDATATVSMTRPPALESVLYRLVNADNRTAFAKEHGLELNDSRVLVVVELEANRSLPSGYDVTVTTRFENEVQAYVGISDLVSLADSDSVRVVRPPTNLDTH